MMCEANLSSKACIDFVGRIKMVRSIRIPGLVAVHFFLLAISSVTAAQENNTYVLPQPAPEFKGVIGTTYKDSKPDKISLVNPPQGAPNVLMILIDDSGYGQWGTYGGQVPTPNLDRVAKSGISFLRFHTTALCSPTRAALLTGRNHHSVGMGTITELADAYPGYSGQIPKSAAMVSEILRQNGYNTEYIGKNHQIADWETSVSGPVDRWPALQGFEHFYGFIGGETNQWQPPLFRDTTPVEMEIPKGKEGHYTLNDSLADEVISYMHNQKSVTPDRPFFVYYAPGATHAPHHVPKEWIAKFKGQFDQGWDKYREETFARQLKLGVIPPDTKLTPRPAEIPAWDSLSPERKRVASRLMETFAAYTAQTDYEVGRVLDALDEMGVTKDTLILWEIGDNGASLEGTLNGSFNEMASLNGASEDVAYLLKHIDEIGGPTASNHIPVGWAWACNTPFQWGKQVASHFGGTRNPLVISWPGHISDPGGKRTQFHDVIDIAPTILEAAHIPQPTEVNGVKQKPIEGISMMYSFKDPSAAEQRHIQYFEMFGNRALYKDGWIAVCRHGRLPWQNSGSADFDKDTWELYDVSKDFSEYNNVAAQNPDKLKELQADFVTEAKKYQVFPLDDRFAERADPSLRPSLLGGRTQFTYYSGVAHIPESSAANTKGKSHTITATVDVPKPGGTEGVIVAEGGTIAGFTLYVKHGKPIYEYNWFGQARYKITSSAAVAPGRNVIKVDFKYDGGGVGKGGMVTLYLNDKKVGEGRIDKTVPVRFSADEAFDTGMDSGQPVSADYQSPFRFSGTMDKVEIDLAPGNLSQADVKEIELAQLQAILARE
jgi:arylsulfatase A-like enzyme